MEMYIDFLKEHRGDEVIRNDMGFAVYRYLDPGIVYVVDIYVVPEFRKHGVASALADKIVEAAKLIDCNKMVGTVVPSAKNSTESLMVLVGYGMKLKCSSDNLIVFEKEI